MSKVSCETLKSNITPDVSPAIPRIDDALQSTALTLSQSTNPSSSAPYLQVLTAILITVQNAISISRGRRDRRKQRHRPCHW